jgi:ESCRT-II complex subunit VPS36
MRLRQYASGVTVVQSLDHDEAALTSKIKHLVAPRSTPVNPGQTSIDLESPGSPGWLLCHLGPGVAAPEVSAALGLPLALAREALLVAEAAGVVARDDGPEGLRFYRNFFPDTSPLLV